MLRQVISVFSASFIIQCANLILYVILARSLSVDDFASFRQLFLMHGILNAVSFSALPACLLYFSGRSQTEGERMEYINSICIVTLVISAALTSCVYLGSDSLAVLFNNPVLAGIMPYFSIASLGILFIILMPTVLIVLNQSKMQIMIAFGSALLTTLPTTIFALNGNSLLDIVRVMSTMYLLVGIILLAIILNFCSFPGMKRIPSRDKILSILGYSWPLLLASGVSILGLKSDHLLISGILGVAAYGIYSVGAFEVPIFSLAQNSVTSVLIPLVTEKLHKADYQGAKKIWGQAITRTAWFTFPIATILILHANDFVVLLFGASYQDSSTVFAIFTALVYVRVVTFGMALRSLGKTRLELLAALIYLMFGVVGAYFFISLHGLIGAAIWVLFNTVLMATTLSMLTYKVSNGKLNLFRLYPKLELIVSLISLLLCGSLQTYIHLSIGNIFLEVITTTIMVLGIWVLYLNIIDYKNIFHAEVN